MKGLVTSAEYQLRDNRPILFLFVRMEDGSRKTIQIFKDPYMYMDLQGYYKLKRIITNPIGDRDKKIARVWNSCVLEKTKSGDQLRTGISGRYKDLAGNQIAKIFVNKPGDVSAIRRVIPYSQGIKIYEADILFPDRCLIDLNIYTGIEIDDYDESITPIGYVDIIPRMVTIDIESASAEGVPFSPELPILCITLHDNYTDRYWTLYTNKEKIDIEGTKCERFDSEPEMLVRFIRLILKLDPDIIAGFNLIRYDIRGIIARLKYYNIPFYNLSPLRYIRKTEREYQIKGRSVLDVFQIYRFLKLSELPEYSLAYIAKEELDKEKVEIEGYFKDEWEKNPKKVLIRNKIDVELTYEIIQTKKIIPYLTMLRTLTGIRYEHITSKKKIIDSTLLRLLRSTSIVLPTLIYKRMKEKWDAAYVMEPKRSVKRKVAVIDVESLYPNSMAHFNISPEVFGIDNPDIPCYKIGKYFFRKDDEGILIKVLKPLLKQKKEIKEKLAHLSGKELDVTQMHYDALKSVINAFYGVIGLTSFRLYNKFVAEAVALAGKTVILSLRDEVEKMGYKVVYIDTDSLFIDFSDYDDPVAEARKVIDKLHKCHHIMEQFNFKGDFPFLLDLEAIASDLLLLTKKRYAYKTSWYKGAERVKYVYKGIQSKRSDTCKLAGDIQKKIINMLLERRSDKDLMDYLNEVRSNFLKHKYSFMDLGVPKQLKKEMDDYVRDTIPHVKGANYANKHFNTFFAKGTKPRYIYVTDVPEGYPDTNVISFDRYTKIPEGFRINFERTATKDIQPKIDEVLELKNLKFIFYKPLSTIDSFF